MPENGDKIYNWLYDDMLSSRQLVLEDKTIHIFEYGAERFLKITNKVWKYKDLTINLENL